LLCEYFGIDTLSSNLVLQPASSSELLVFSQTLSRLEKHIAELRLHLRVNGHASSRICAKVIYAGDVESGNAHQSRWLEAQRAREAQYLRVSQKLSSLSAKVTSAWSDASAEVPPESLHLRNIFLKVKFDVEFYSEVLLSIANDQHERLVDFCHQHIANRPQSHFQVQELFSGLLHTAFVYRSRQCLHSLVSFGNKEGKAIMNAACVLDLVKLHCQPSFSPRYAISQQMTSITSLDTKADILLELFQRLDLVHEIGLHYSDKSGRMLLHCVAEYGLTSICMLILEGSKKDFRAMDSAAKGILSPDFQNETPLHCAVINNHLEITKLFLTYLTPNGPAGVEDRVSNIFVDIMIIAIVLGFDEIVEAFISAQIGISQQNSRGETALYIAAKYGRDDYVRLLLQDPSTRQVIDTAEYAYGWPPLFVACTEGHSATTELLLHAGADCTRVDIRGWSITEHATFRGHLELATLLHSWTRTTSASNFLGEYHRPGAVDNNVIPKDQSYVIVHLGSVQRNRLLDPVKLIPSIEDNGSTSGMETGLWLELSIRGGKTKRRMQLPVMGDMANEPIVLPCNFSKRSQLVFNLYRETTSPNSLEEVLVGSGIVLINYGHRLDQKRESLGREYFASIMARETLECIGLVAFTLVISRPYNKLQEPLEEGSWFGKGNVQIAGHRGSFSLDCDQVRDTLTLFQDLVRTCKETIFSLERTRFR
jgi:ankyrin repeat protein